MLLKLLAVSLTALLIMQTALAIGASPAKFSIGMPCNSTKELRLRVINNDMAEIEVEVSVIGELAGYTSVSRERFSMGSNEGAAEVLLKITIPAGVLPEGIAEGKHLSSNILVQASHASQGSMINVIGAVIAKLSVDIIPESPAREFPDSYSAKQIPTPKGGEELSSEGGFVVEQGLLSGSSPFLHLSMLGAMLIAALLLIKYSSKLLGSG